MNLFKRGNQYIFSTILFDLSVDKYIKLELIDPITLQVLSVNTILHGVSGVYIKSDIQAVNSGVILAKYLVYNDIGLTSLNKKYAPKLITVRVEDIQETLENTIDLNDGRTI